jgi:hypothetical protein
LPGRRLREHGFAGSATSGPQGFKSVVKVGLNWKVRLGAPRRLGLFVEAQSQKGGLDVVVWRSSRRRLLIGLGGILLVGFVMADDAASDHTDLAVPRHVAGDTTDNGAFDASLRLGGTGSKRDAENSGTKDQRLHGDSPERPVVATIRVALIGSGEVCDIVRAVAWRRNTLAAEV